MINNVTANDTDNQASPVYYPLSIGKGYGLYTSGVIGQKLSYFKIMNILSNIMNKSVQDKQMIRAFFTYLFNLMQPDIAKSS